jgi:hypothetical protein
MDGRKKNTWRLFDDKDLKTGDMVDFLDSDTKKKFTTVKLTDVEEKTFETLDEHDWAGHEKYPNENDMYIWFEAAYKQPVDSATKVKVIWFELL